MIHVISIQIVCSCLKFARLAFYFIWSFSHLGRDLKKNDRVRVTGSGSPSFLCLLFSFPSLSLWSLMTSALVGFATSGEEEAQIRKELNQFIIEAEKEHGSLADKLVTLDERYQALAELELELMDIRRRKNIIVHEKTVKIVNTETLSQDTIESLRKDLEERKDDLSAVYKAAQPVCSDINHLCHKL